VKGIHQAEAALAAREQAVPVIAVPFSKSGRPAMPSIQLFLNGL